MNWASKSPLKRFLVFLKSKYFLILVNGDNFLFVFRQNCLVVHQNLINKCSYTRVSLFYFLILYIYFNPLIFTFVSWDEKVTFIWISFHIIFLRPFSSNECSSNSVRNQIVARSRFCIHSNITHITTQNIK